MVRLRGRFCLVLSRCCWISAQLHFSRWGFFRLYVVVSIEDRISAKCDWISVVRR